MTGLLLPLGGKCNPDDEYDDDDYEDDEDDADDDDESCGEE